MPPFALTLRGCGRPVNQWTVSIWWHIHWPGMPEEYGQNSRYSRYFRGSHASAGRFIRNRFQSVSLSLMALTEVRAAPAAGLVHVPRHLGA